ncbi:MAG: ribosome maturation factor RimM [Bacillota bacterium]|nr:ribosome maturation factor RimM [Bacillota bacterium]
MIHIGTIVRHHGIRGEFKVYPHTEDPEKFLGFSRLYADAQGKKPLEIEAARLHGKMVLIQFRGYPTIESGLALIGSPLYIERERVDDGQGGHFVVDLIGCEVFDRGESIGVLRDVLQHTAQDVYEIERPNGKLCYIPVVDEFVISIDVERKRIDVQTIPGLLDD